MADDPQSYEEDVTAPPGVEDISTIVKNLQDDVQAL